MSLSLYNLKKWAKMIAGNSELHIPQEKGEYYRPGIVSGYYNDLTGKIIKSKIKEEELPTISIEGEKEKQYFPISIFQYGLGAYDLYLSTSKKEYLRRFERAVEWAIENQDANGGWKCRFDKTHNVYSSMAQGEGVSLLARAYTVSGDSRFLKPILKAKNCMLRSKTNNGTAVFNDKNLILLEHIEQPAVLNGWIFSIFGLYDYLLIKPDDKKTKKEFDATVNTLKNSLKDFDLGYWSKYDIANRIASPFYHKLHISLLYALFDITGEKIFRDYAFLFEKYRESNINSVKAFTKKVIQKIRE